MSKVFKKMKLNELQKENVGAKEMQCLTGGFECSCASTCLDAGGDVENAISVLSWQNKYCGCY